MPSKASQTTPTGSSSKPAKKPKVTPKKKPGTILYRLPEDGTRLLALDQSSKLTGWSLLEVHGGMVKLVAYGLLDVSRDENRKELDADQRVPVIIAKVGLLIEKTKPTAIALEEPFIGRNFGSSALLFRCFGAIEAVAVMRNLPFYSVTPQEAKAFVLRNHPGWTKLVELEGISSKVLVKQVLSEQFGVPFSKPGNDKVCDDSDAAAVGLAVLYKKMAS
jgi:Holliday junction resolvasome RuvABC endonuclease subunit